VPIFSSFEFKLVEKKKKKKRKGKEKEKKKKNKKKRDANMNRPYISNGCDQLMTAMTTSNNRL